MNSEDIVKVFIESKGLIIERFSKEELRSMKTPDFKVFHGEDFAFYCEVKESEEDQWINNKLKDATPGEVVGGSREDPVFNRLTTHIHKARKQFDSVNPEHIIPNVLSFYNSDENYGFNDLLGVVTGNFYGDDGTCDKIYGKYSDGRLKDDLTHIDLIIWLDRFKPMRYYFVTQVEEVCLRLSEYLNYNYSKITRLAT